MSNTILITSSDKVHVEIDIFGAMRYIKDSEEI